MLTVKENELLCQVGKGTPMGDLFRRYWLPALPSSDIPDAQSPPVRVRLLGEDLVAFRGGDGRIGLLAEHCAHRRTSLFFASNEECGLRCIYHGWQYDVEGNIIDTPGEPAGSMMKHHIKQPAYPCHEANGLIYTYMGPKDRIPLFPALPWTTLAPEHVEAKRKAINDCNWLQTQEGNVDSVHTAFLHSRRGRSPQAWRNQNNPPSFDVEQTSWGVRAVVRYPAEDNETFIRTNTFIMPVYTCLPNGESVDGKLDGFSVNVEVPRDDYSTMRYTIDVQRTLTPRHRMDPLDEILPNGIKLRNLKNDYLIDRAKQRSGEMLSGLDCSFTIQDGCAVESMGIIADRENEHLGTTDTQIAAVRRFLMDSIKKNEEGIDPPGVAYDVEDNDYSDLYLMSAVVPSDRDWKESLPDVTTHILARV